MADFITGSEATKLMDTEFGDAPRDASWYKARNAIEALLTRCCDTAIKETERRLARKTLCVYCGREVDAPDGTKLDVTAAHVEECQWHPIHAILKIRAALDDVLEPWNERRQVRKDPTDDTG